MRKILGIRDIGCSEESGKLCWICKSEIKSERTVTSRSTFWCPNCQQ